MECKGVTVPTTTWSIQTWSVQTWSVQTWSVQTWSVQAWSVQTWSVQTWSVQTWSIQTWSVHTWSVQTWSVQTSSVRWLTFAAIGDRVSDKKTIVWCVRFNKKHFPCQLCALALSKCTMRVTGEYGNRNPITRPTFN